MKQEKWVIKTNKGRYVTIPFMLTSGFKSYLNDSPTDKSTRRYNSEKEAEEYLRMYLDPKNPHYVDKWTLQDGEKLIGVESVFQQVVNPNTDSEV